MGAACGISIYLVIMLLIKICGMAVRSMQADGLLSGVVPEGGRVADFALMYGIQAASPSILITGLFAVIVLSAVMSTTDRLMLTVGTTFSWDIFKTMLKPKASERQVVLVSQICVLLAAVISLILAINPPEMLAFLIWLGIGLMLSAFAVPMIAGLYWRRATAAGAIASMLIGPDHLSGVRRLLQLHRQAADALLDLFAGLFDRRDDHCEPAYEEELREGT